MDEAYDFFSLNWAGLPWTSWIPFSDLSAFRGLPSGPGVYRIRAVQRKELFYIGETGRNVRERLRDLRLNTLKPTMPFNDPHTAAPSLWAWRDAENLEFECSAAAVNLADDPEVARKLREGLEFYLLWQYRLACGTSTLCNHGRFHPRYTKSTSSKQGVRGIRIQKDEPDNPAGGPSSPPLQQASDPTSNDWMGLLWSSTHQLSSVHHNIVPSLPGVYKIFTEDGEIIYIGETNNLNDRLNSHAKKRWGNYIPLFAFVQLPENIPSYQRREIENDLLGAFYARTRKIPEFQLINLKPIAVSPKQRATIQPSIVRR